MPIVKKIQCLERTQYAFLDNSKTLVFSGVIKREIPFKFTGARAIRIYSSPAKKNLYTATLTGIFIFDGPPLVTSNSSERCNEEKMTLYTQ